MAIPAYDAEKIPLKRQFWMILERFLYSLVSLLLGMKIRGCRLTIQSFHFPCTLNNIMYSESWSEPTRDNETSDESNKTSPDNRTNPSTQLSRDCTISVSRVSVSFHIPRPSNPRWATIVISSYNYVDADCRASADRAVVLLSIFPVLFRISHGPWASVALHDMHLRVFTSRRFPAWVDALCTDMISTVLEGDILRINDLYTTVDMGITQSREEYNDELHGGNNPRGELKKKKKNHTEQALDSDDEYMSQNYNGKDDQDEAKVALNLQCAIIRNSRNRIYSFNSLDLRLGRREFMEAGSLDIAVRGSQWTKAVILPEPVQEEHSTFLLTKILRIFFRGISGIPSQVYALIKNPVNAADVYVSRGDVTFDHFRIHDAGIMTEGNKAVGNWFSKHHESTKGFLWDMFSAGLTSLLSPDANTCNQPEETDCRD